MTRGNDFLSIHTHRKDCSAGNECDCPGPRYYVALDVIKAVDDVRQDRDFMDWLRKRHEEEHALYGATG